MSDVVEKKDAEKEVEARKLALEQAQKLVRKKLQTSIKDVPVFTIGVDAEHKSFHRLIMQRFKRISSICSTKILGAPVTPPILLSSSCTPEEMYTYHIVQLVDSKKGKVLLLFRETDMYFVAFNPSGNLYSEWFTFKDTPIPTFFKQIRLPYDCRYRSIASISIGFFCFSDIFEVLSKYNKENVKEENDDRDRVLQCVPLMLSETSKFGDLQISVKIMLRDYIRKHISQQMDDKIRSWGNLGRYSMRYLCGEDVLSHVVNLFPGVYDHEKEGLCCGTYK